MDYLALNISHEDERNKWKDCLFFKINPVRVDRIGSSDASFSRNDRLEGNNKHRLGGGHKLEHRHGAGGGRCG